MSFERRTCILDFVSGNSHQTARCISDSEASWNIECRHPEPQEPGMQPPTNPAIKLRTKFPFLQKKKKKRKNLRSEGSKHRTGKRRLIRLVQRAWRCTRKKVEPGSPWRRPRQSERRRRLGASIRHRCEQTSIQRTLRETKQTINTRNNTRKNPIPNLLLDLAT
jgi:hypothetical protein